MQQPAEPLAGWQREADALLAAGQHGPARDLYQKVLAADPGNVYVIYQLAGSLEGLGLYRAADDLCGRGLALAPDQPALLHRRAGIAVKRNQYVFALETYRRLRSLHPDFPLIDAMVGDQLASLGRGAEAIDAFDRALARAPDIVRLQSDRLFVLNYFGLMSRAELFDEHRRWGAAHEETLRGEWAPHEQSAAPDRKLKVGYVSADLRNHAVAFFIEGVLRNHDHSKFEIHAIDVSPYAEDAVTHRLRGNCDHWHRLGHLDDAALASFIRQRQLDILVDLSGHTAHNRLLVFARRPAPVQVGWFGYMHTTGLTAIDYRLTDAGLDPPGESDAMYTEKLFRLPSMACFQPDPLSPEVGQLPALRTGRVTIGSLNQWTKVTPMTKDVWARVLVALPSSKLVVVARGGADPAVRAEITAEFTRRSVHRDRIEVLDFMPTAEFLRLLGRIDFALDPFPYGGGTTTLHCAWIGVPVVTLETDSELGRSTPGILRVLGLEALIADDVDQYVRIAVDLANDVERLSGYRGVLRERFRRSPLMDAEPLKRSVENAFRQMWHEWCENRGTEKARYLRPGM